MNRKFFWLITAIFVGLVHRAEAQQPAKVSRIGFLGTAGKDRIDAFRQALRHLGWVEGLNITIEYRSDSSEPDRLPKLAAELQQAKILLLHSIPLSESSIHGIASGLLDRSLRDLPLDEPITAAKRYLALTAADVQTAFAKWIRSKTSRRLCSDRHRSK